MIRYGYTPTKNDLAEIALYMDAFAAAIKPEQGGRYYNASRTEQQMIKNDAERAGAAASPQAQKWYDAGRALISKHRSGPNFAPDWSRILAEKDGVLTHMIMRKVSGVLKPWRSYKVEVPINGSGHATNGNSNGDCADKYLALIEGWALIPPDSIVGHLLGVPPARIGHLRRGLKGKMWTISPAEMPEWADGRETWWRVEAKPPTEAEIKAALAEKLTGKIKSLSPDELQALIELVG